MSNIEKVNELLQLFMKEFPTLKNGNKLIGKYVINLADDAEQINLSKDFVKSYKQFENWLNKLFEQEKVPDNIIAINFGLYESDDGIQPYISGSTDWDFHDDDWASSNDYFPEGRYPEITLYKDLLKYRDDNFELGLFLTISSTIIFTNTYLIDNPTKFPPNVVLSTGFDDGDLYNFSKKSYETITVLVG
ncbi:hypothetical protein [Psychrobacillus sp. NPDC093180]|uniref:hypothetical protein n=1 Tax=Psychrobacillus sp. NPDC093180 TaxID=3364489 RepID=UPI0038198941